MNVYKKKLLITAVTCYFAGVASYHIYVNYSMLDFGIATLLFTGGIFFKSAVKDFFA